MYQYGLYSVYFLASELDLLQARVVHNFIGPCEITSNVIPDCLGHSVDAAPKDIGVCSPHPFQS